MNPNNNNTLAENPNSDRDDFGVFDRLDKKSFAGSLKEGVKAIGNGIKTGGKALQEGADAIGREVLDKNASTEKKRMVGYGVEGAGMAGLVLLASKMFTGRGSRDSNSGKEKSTESSFWTWSKRALAVGTIGAVGYGIYKNIPDFSSLMKDFGKAELEEVKNMKDQLEANSKAQLEAMKNTMEANLAKIANLSPAAEVEIVALKKQNKDLQSSIKNLNDTMASLASGYTNKIVESLKQGGITPEEAEKLGVKPEELQTIENELANTPKNPEIPPKEEWIKIAKKRIIASYGNMGSGLFTNEELEKYFSEENYNIETISQEVSNNKTEIAIKALFVFTITRILSMFTKSLWKKLGIGGGVLMLTQYIQSPEFWNQQGMRFLEGSQLLFSNIDADFDALGLTREEMQKKAQEIMGEDIWKFITFQYKPLQTDIPQYIGGFSELEKHIKSKNIVGEKLKIKNECLNFIEQKTLILQSLNKDYQNSKDRISMPMWEDLIYFLQSLEIQYSVQDSSITGQFSITIQTSPQIIFDHLYFNPDKKNLTPKETTKATEFIEYRGIQKCILEFQNIMKTKVADNPQLSAQSYKTFQEYFTQINQEIVSGKKIDKEAFWKKVDEFSENVSPVKRYTNDNGIIYCKIDTLQYEISIGIEQEGDNKFDFAKQHVQEISLINEEHYWDIVNTVVQRPLIEQAKEMDDGLDEIYRGLPENDPLRIHIQKYKISDNITSIADSAIPALGWWWAEFFILSLQKGWNVSMDHGKILVGKESNVIIGLATDWFSAQWEGLKSVISMGYFGDITWEEWVVKSFASSLSLGLVGGTVKGAINAISNKGAYGRSAAFTSGLWEGTRMGVKINPFYQGIAHGSNYFWKRQLVIPTLLGENKAKEYGKLSKEYYTKGHFLPNSFQANRPNEHKGIAALTQKYLDLNKELALYKGAGTDKISIAGRSAQFLTGSNIEMQMNYIEQTIQNMFGGGSESEAFKSWKDERDLAKKSPYNGSYQLYLTGEKPKGYFHLKLDAIKKAYLSGKITDTEVLTKKTTLLTELNAKTPPPIWKTDVTNLINNFDHTKFWKIKMPSWMGKAGDVVSRAPESIKNAGIATGKFATKAAAVGVKTGIVGLPVVASGVLYYDAYKQDKLADKTRTGTANSDLADVYDNKQVFRNAQGTVSAVEAMAALKGGSKLLKVGGIAGIVLIPISIVAENAFQSFERGYMTTGDYLLQKEKYSPEKLLQLISLTRDEKTMGDLFTSGFGMWEKPGNSPADMRAQMWGAYISQKIQQEGVVIGDETIRMAFIQHFITNAQIQTENPNIQSSSEIFKKAEESFIETLKTFAPVATIYQEKLAQKKQQESEYSIEKNKLEGIDKEFTQIAKEIFQWKGPYTKESLHAFFDESKETIYGFYWDKSEQQWNFHHSFMLVKDKEVINTGSYQEQLQIALEIITQHHSSIYYSEQESFLDGIREKTLMRQISENNAFQIFRIFLKRLIENSEFITDIKNATTTEEKACLIFLLQKGKLSKKLIEEIESQKRKTIIFSNFSSFNLQTKTFYNSLREDLNPVEYSIEELNHNQHLTGDAIAFQQCLQIAKELSTPPPATPSS